MINLKKLITSIFLLSLLLAACGGQPPAEPRGPGQEFFGPGPNANTLDEIYFSKWFNTEESCKDTWVNKVRSGDANFAGFEIDSKVIGRDVKDNQYGSDVMVSYRIFLTGIRIENYHVDILNQTVTYLPNPEAGDAQIPDRDTILAQANDLAKTAPDLRAGMLFMYNPTKLDTEAWVDFSIQCDTTNTIIFTVP